MTLGQIVDFCIECANRRIEAEGSLHREEEPQAPKRRKATQADWDRFWG